MALKPKFRPATLAGASSLAVLIDIAGNGLPNKTWFDQVGPGHSALEEGRQVVRRNEGEDSYRNATVALMGTEIGAPATSIVVGSWNDGAARLYGRSGCKPAARERASLPNGFPHAGEWILMTRPPR